MQAICLQKPQEFVQVDVPEPAKCKPGEALVAVHNVGICGTDYSGYFGKFAFMKYPRILGHELGVEVLEVGSGVTNVKSGDKCSVEPYINCQSCPSCRMGKTNCCENLEVLGVHTDGGMRSRFIVPARKLHPSKELELEQLALVETLAIGCHAVNRGNPQAGENVLVIGAGPIGLSVIEFVRLSEARLIVADVHDGRLEFCRSSMDVESTIKFSDNVEANIEELKKICDGQLPTLVIDATGNQKAMCAAFNYIGFAGRMVYVGIVTGDITFPDPIFHRREMSLYASRNALPGDFTRIIKLIEDGKIDTDTWITHRTDYNSFIGDFPAFTKPETGVIKAMLRLS